MELVTVALEWCIAVIAAGIDLVRWIIDFVWSHVPSVGRNGAMLITGALLIIAGAIVLFGIRVFHLISMLALIVGTILVLYWGYLTFF